MEIGKEKERNENKGILRRFQSSSQGFGTDFEIGKGPGKKNLIPSAHKVATVMFSKILDPSGKCTPGEELTFGSYHSRQCHKKKLNLLKELIGIGKTWKEIERRNGPFVQVKLAIILELMLKSREKISVQNFQSIHRVPNVMLTTRMVEYLQRRLPGVVLTFGNSYPYQEP
ncbi:hypothetical protein O181_046275 [Austropuccinia psidii MF-1]|uniref:Uncharacterized protein n=1 Tax=Austropuccinia psidii MF-1 TaxID=1389203 RepID=A0A9Q3HM09_9BASI|nr:hypothetical protein [Austropuccinia psidii MF-1]